MAYLTSDAKRAYQRAYHDRDRTANNAKQRHRRREQAELEAPIKAAAKLALLVHREALATQRRAERDRIRRERERDRAAKELGDALARLRKRLQPKEPSARQRKTDRRVHPPELRAEMTRQRARESYAVRGALELERKRKNNADARARFLKSFHGPRWPLGRRRTREGEAPLQLTKAEFLERFIGPPRPPRPVNAPRLTKAGFLLSFIGPPRPPKKPKAPKVPSRTVAEYRVQRTAQAEANAQTKAELQTIAKAARARTRAEREQPKAKPAKDFRRAFMGPPKPKGFCPPPKDRTEAENSELLEQKRSVQARQDALTAYRTELRRAEQARYQLRASQVAHVIQPAPPRPPLDLSLIERITAEALERRRSSQAAADAIDANHTPTTS